MNIYLAPDRSALHGVETSPIKGILKTSNNFEPSHSDLHLPRPMASFSEGVGSLDSSADLINYARAVLEMDKSIESVRTSIDR